MKREILPPPPKAEIRRAWEQSGGNLSRMAKDLKRPRNTVRYWVKTMWGPPAWKELKDIRGDDRAAFERSRLVYDQQFDRDVRQPWDEIQRCLAANEPLNPPFRDRYFVAVSDDEVTGMVFLTEYRDFCFVSYFATPPHGLSHVGMRALSDVFLEIGKKKLVFELERISPLLIRQSRDHRIVRRASAHRVFQRLGARKIGALLYEQPVLDDLNEQCGRGDRDVYLMVFDPDLRRRPSELPRSEVLAILGFVYRRFYRDGFRDKWGPARSRRHTELIYRRVVSTLPRTAEWIPLHEVKQNRRGRGMCVRIAAETRVRPLCVELLVDRLESLGAVVTTESRGRRGRVLGCRLEELPKGQWDVNIVVEFTRLKRESPRSQRRVLVTRSDQGGDRVGEARQSTRIPWSDDVHDMVERIAAAVLRMTV